jgi:hypothetical protein
MDLEGLRLSSAVFWRASWLFSLVDLAFFLLWLWRLRRPHFRHLKWPSFAGALAVWLPI